MRFSINTRVHSVYYSLQASNDSNWKCARCMERDISLIAALVYTARGNTITAGISCSNKPLFYNVAI